MDTNLAYNLPTDWNDTPEEMLNGRIILMSPQPVVNHRRVSYNISKIFDRYLNEKKCSKCEMFNDGVDVHLTEKDTVIPDVMIVCNKDYIKDNGIFGPPSLIVEVLSPSTANHDKGYKKNLYERCGVSEYWIVDILSKSIEVYVLKEGKYELDNVYQVYPEAFLKKVKPEEEHLLIYEFKTSLFDDLVINIEEIFSVLK